MRRPFLIVAVLLAGPGGAEGERGGAGGRAVRVEHPEAERARVPAGRLIMGVPADDIEALLEECRLTVGATVDTVFDQCRNWDAVLERRKYRLPGVWIDGFWIDVNEVTAGAYRACARSGRCSVAPLVTGDVRHLGDELPVVNVTREEAMRFCAWRGGRLPTEAEWERAARGDDLRTWPWGDAPRPDDFNHGKVRTAVLTSLDQVTLDPSIRVSGDPDDTDGWMYAAPPGKMRWSDSPYGVHDLAGNVAEWVLDDFDELGFDGLSRTNPLRVGLPGSTAMTRGGSWRDPPFCARVDLPSYQSAFTILRPLDPETRAIHIGFRCVYGAAAPEITAPAPLSPTP